MITLAMMKMRKNFIAVLEKGYPKQPYEEFSSEYLTARIREELEELEKALKDESLYEALFELADISNLVDFCFERIARDRIKLLNKHKREARE